VLCVEESVTLQVPKVLSPDTKVAWVCPVTKSIIAVGVETVGSSLVNLKVTSMDSPALILLALIPLDEKTYEGATFFLALGLGLGLALGLGLETAPGFSVPLLLPTLGFFIFLTKEPLLHTFFPLLLMQVKLFLSMVLTVFKTEHLLPGLGAPTADAPALPKREKHMTNESAIANFFTTSS
jgi:hypothetical protein